MTRVLCALILIGTAVLLLCAAREGCRPKLLPHHVSPTAEE